MVIEAVHHPGRGAVTFQGDRPRHLGQSVILSGRQQGLWDVNTDSDYQESAEIQTGYGARSSST